MVKKNIKKISNKNVIKKGNNKNVDKIIKKNDKKIGKNEKRIEKLENSIKYIKNIIEDVENIISLENKGIIEVKKMFKEKYNLDDNHINNLNELKIRMEDMEKIVQKIQNLENYTDYGNNEIKKSISNIEIKIKSMDIDEIKGNIIKISRIMTELQDDISYLKKKENISNLKEINEKVSRMENKIEIISKKSSMEDFSDIEIKFKNINNDLNELKNGIKYKNNDVLNIENNSNNNFDMKKELNILKDKINEKNIKPIELIEMEFSDMSGRIIALETRLGRIENILENLGSKKPLILE